MKKKVLVLACHPDDDILGCGGYFDKFKYKYQFRVVFLAEGSSCRYNNHEKYKKKINNDILFREKCAIKALKTFSISNVCFYNNICGQLNKLPQININKIIEKEIKVFKPNIILTHSNKDLNLDHKTISEAVMVATRPTKIKEIVSEIYSFEILSSTHWNFQNSFKPQYFIELSKTNIMNKWKALKCYPTEIIKKPYPRSFYGLETLAKFRGMQCGSIYAESFEIIRYFEK
tara:strand:- start:27 stop:719 length:693 start_codon:yes stop_codon:yes gene_type:complete